MKFEANKQYTSVTGLEVTIEKVTGTWVYLQAKPYQKQKVMRIYLLEDGTEAFMLNRKVERTDSNIAYCFSRARTYQVVTADGRTEIASAGEVRLKHTGRSKASVKLEFKEPNTRLAKVNGAGWKRDLKQICKGYCVHVSAAYITGVKILETAHVALSRDWVAPAGRGGYGGTAVGNTSDEFARRLSLMTTARKSGMWKGIPEAEGMTVNQFVKKFPTGTYSVCNKVHCWTIEDGVIVDWDRSSRRVISHCAQFA